MIEDCFAESRRLGFEVHNLYEDGGLWHVRLKLDAAGFHYSFGEGDSPLSAFQAALADATTPRKPSGPVASGPVASAPFPTLTLKDL